MTKFFNLSIQKRLAVGVMVIAMLFGMMSFVRPAQAQTVDEILLMIQEMLAQVAELQAQLAEVRGDNPAGASPAGQFTRNLGIGDRGDQVRALQVCLDELGYYDGDEITNYFGPVTRRAVEQFQAANGIVSSGNAWTTGYGRVGQQTRAALNDLCPLPIPEDDQISNGFNASPTSGNAPLSVVFTSSWSGQAGSATIDFGDGESEDVDNCYAPYDLCLEPGTNTHTYDDTGTYTAQLISDFNQEVIDEVTIVVTDEASGDDPSINVSSRGGLEVDIAASCSFSEDYTVDLGDGNMLDNECNTEVDDENGGTQIFSDSHEYAEAGTYTLTLLDGNGVVLDTATITVDVEDDGTDPEPFSDDEIAARINFIQTARSLGNNHGQQVLLADGTVYDHNEWFPLTEDGEFIEDGAINYPDGGQNFNGLVVRRNGNGTIRVNHFGENETGYEMTEGRFVVRNATIERSSIEEIQFENHGSSVNDNFRTRQDLDYTEYLDNHRVQFGTAVYNGNDAFRLRILPNEDIFLRIVFDQIDFDEGTAHGDRVLLADGTKYDSGEWFPVTENGEYIDDDVRAQNVDGADTFEGYAVSRLGDGRLQVAHVGENEEGHEFAEGRIFIRNGEFVRSYVDDSLFERHRTPSETYGTQYELDYVRFADSGRIQFGTYVSTGTDVIKLGVEASSGEVLGASVSVDQFGQLDVALASLEDTLVSYLHTIE